MNTTAASLGPDPIALINSLHPDSIASRLSELAAEMRALRVLMRAARARERRHQRQPPPSAVAPRVR